MRPLASWIKIVFWLLALSVLSVAGGYVLARGPLVTVKAVSPGDMVQTVVATGRVQNPHRVDIGAQIVGVVRAVPVKEGQSVRASQVLIELDDAELRANRMQTEMSVTQAQSQLRRLQEVQAPLAEQSVRQAIINLEQAQRNLARHEELYDRDFIGRATLDESWRQASLSQSQLVSTMHQWVSTHEGGSELAMAQSTLRQAQASHAAAQVRWTYAAIKAPMSGVLIARNVEVGDVVQPGKSLMTLSPSGETQIVVQIDEKHLGLLRLGQQALASADAFPGQRFEAEVIYVNPGIDPQRGSVEVKLRVAAPPAYLRQDMTVSVDIEVARRSQVLRIPMDAIHDETSSEPWVFTVQEGRVLKTPIRTGLKAAGQVEVLQGLKSGDAVVTQSAKTLSSGQRIRTSRT
jgi:HlyD family secretion protein